MRPPNPDAIAATASHIAFGRPIVQNNLRALVAEVIVGAALGSTWQHCSGDWQGWDFEHETGVRLEVKQSARRQSWMTTRPYRVPRFDIRERTGYWEKGVTWIRQNGRYAHLYVFAYHRLDDVTADQRDPSQWIFYVVQTTQLPNRRTISLSDVTKLSSVMNWTELRNAVERSRLSLKCDLLDQEDQ